MIYKDLFGCHKKLKWFYSWSVFNKMFLVSK